MTYTINHHADERPYNRGPATAGYVVVGDGGLTTPMIIPVTRGSGSAALWVLAGAALLLGIIALIRFGSKEATCVGPSRAMAAIRGGWQRVSEDHNIINDVYQ